MDLSAHMVDGVPVDKTPAEIAEEYRDGFDAERDSLFEETAWARERHADRAALGIDDSENWTAWLSYWQALRDMPDAGGFDPTCPSWPLKPE